MIKYHINHYRVTVLYDTLHCKRLGRPSFVYKWMKRTLAEFMFYSSEVCSESESFCAIDSLPSTLSAIILTESGLFYGKQNHLTFVKII